MIYANQGSCQVKLEELQLEQYGPIYVFESFKSGLL